MTKTFINITDSAGKIYPAELRSAVPESLLVCIYRDFQTARLVSVAFEWQKSTSSWLSSDGFTCEYEVASLPREEVSVRIP
jgi:hypothetical protein